MKYFLMLMAVMAFYFAAQGQEVACAGDIQKFCKGVAPARGGIVKCLRKHHEELSGECKMQAGKIKVAMQGIAEACHEDYDKFCADIKPGRGAVVKCMQKHRDELSEKCQKEVVQARQSKKVQEAE